MLLWGSNTFAQEVSIPEKTIKVSLVNASGENGISNERALELFTNVKQLYSEDLALTLKLVKYRKRRNPYKQTLETSNRLRVLRGWEGYFKRRRDTNKAVLHLVIMNPIKDQGHYWLAGYANGTCMYKRLTPVAVSNAEEYNSVGVPRFAHSTYALAHEAGHLLGAPHDDSLPATVMHSACMAYVDAQGGELHFSQSSFSKIRKCVR